MTPSTRLSAASPRYVSASSRPGVAAASTSTWPDIENSLSTPAMKAWKNGSAAITSGLRPITRPSANERSTLSDLARTLGRQPSSSATARMRSRVSALTPGRSLSAKETRPLLTPACAATSAMVGRPPFDAFAEPAPSDACIALTMSLRSDVRIHV